ncbi:MAG: peptide chain release factor family protein [Rubripirellula sp.]
MADSSSRTHEAAKIPDPDQRLPIVLVNNPHPALLHPDQLLGICDLRTQRRSGPGGQHRNKTSSGAFLHYPPTNTTAEATERRSQADNRKIALERLRFRLAVEVRSPSPIDGHEMSSEENQLRERYQGESLKISDRNSDKPAVLALLLNDLHVCGGQPSAVGPFWQASTSALVRLIKSQSSAFAFLNQIRQHHGRLPLR